VAEDAGPAGTAEPRKKVARKALHEPSGRPAGRKHLPWDISTIPHPTRLSLAPTACGRAFACAKDAVASTSRCVGINVTASIPSAAKRWLAGRPPNVSNSGGAVRRFGNSTRLPSASGEPAWPQTAICRPFEVPRLGKLTARGHAGEKILPRFATAPAATNLAAKPAAARRSTVATSAAKPANGSGIVSASGCGAGNSRKHPRTAARLRKSVWCPGAGSARQQTPGLPAA
jgi:hypothetical protein